MATASTSGSKARACLFIAGTIGLAALVLQAWINWHVGHARGLKTATIVLRYSSYFTIVANLLVASAFLAASIAPRTGLGKFANSPSVRGALLLYISVVGLVYVAVLARLWNPQGAQWWADILLHYVTPALSILLWPWTAPVQRLPWRTALNWLWVPGLYLVWVLAYGARTHHYPYPFLNAHTLGYQQALLGAARITALFLGGGLIIVAITRLRGK